MGARGWTPAEPPAQQAMMDPGLELQGPEEGAGEAPPPGYDASSPVGTAKV
jgi:hypothetical protein